MKLKHFNAMKSKPQLLAGGLQSTNGMTFTLTI